MTYCLALDALVFNFIEIKQLTFEPQYVISDYVAF